jgi:hypothetical protein
MTLQQTHDGQAAAAHVDDKDVVAATIHHYMTQERDQADRYAGTAAHHREQATALEDQAMACRVREERWRRLLDLEAARPADIPGEPLDDGGVQTVLFPRIRQNYPLVHAADGTPHLACIRCGAALRAATASEVEVISGGGAITPSPECDGGCTPSGPVRIGTLPYPPSSPDAA